MALIVPDALELEVINNILTPTLTLRLNSNNVTPTATSTTASFIEVIGGGYVNKPLIFANWIITAGAPTSALYSVQSFTFTGPTGAPSTIFGYYVTRNSDNKLMWAERFPSAIVPFTPIAGSKIQIIPKFTVQSQF